MDLSPKLLRSNGHKSRKHFTQRNDHGFFILHVLEGSSFKCLTECSNHDEKCAFNCISSGFPMNKNLKKGFDDIISTLNRVDQGLNDSIVDNTVTPNFVLVID